MEIGILALVIGAVMCAVSLLGVSGSEPARTEKKAVYPYPFELQ